MLPNNVFVNCQNATILIRIWINFYFSRKLLLKRSLKEAKPVVTLICKLIIIPLHYLVAIVERNMSDSKLPIIVVCSEGVKTSQEIIDSKFYRNSNFNTSLFIKKISLKICGKKQQTKTQLSCAMDLLALNFTTSRNTMKMISFSYHTNQSTLIWCLWNYWTKSKGLSFTLTRITYVFAISLEIQNFI